MPNSVQAAATPHLRPDSASAPRVLVVDDDHISRDLLTRMLALLGFTGVATDDPNLALEIAAGGKVDAMLLDLGMPEVDGFAVLRALRQAEAQQERAALTVIAVTGYSADSDRLRCLVAGFQEHLAKPVECTILQQLLQRLLAAELPADSDAARVRAAAQRLARIKPQDASFAPNMLETFAMRSGHLVEEAARQVTARDPQQLQHCADALRASAEFMGARELGQVASALVAHAEAGDWTAAAQGCTQLRAVHQVVLAVLLSARQQPTQDRGRGDPALYASP